jgi:hypothetical protein
MESNVIDKLIFKFLKIILIHKMKFTPCRDFILRQSYAISTQLTPDQTSS